MKIVLVCGQGLGSSFMAQMTVSKILEDASITGIQVEHSDVNLASSLNADLYVTTKDLKDNLNNCGGELLVVDNIINKSMIREKLFLKLKEMGVSISEGE